jgi:hypothetical protein
MVRPLMQDDEDLAKQQQLFESDYVPEEDLDTVMKQIMKDSISTDSIVSSTPCFSSC